MERRRGNCDLYLPLSHGIEGYSSRGDLVDRRRSSNGSVFGGLDILPMGDKEGGSAMLSPARIRPLNRWPAIGIDDPCLSIRKVLQVTEERESDMMPERRPATTISELDLHLGYLMEELREMRNQQQEMVHKLATKEEVATQINELKQQIAANSPRSFWKGLTEIAVGITALATAVGFIIAIFRFLKL
jgi:hypothetical protein